MTGQRGAGRGEHWNSCGLLRRCPPPARVRIPQMSLAMVSAARMPSRDDATPTRSMAMGRLIRFPVPQVTDTERGSNYLRCFGENVGTNTFQLCQCRFATAKKVSHSYKRTTSRQANFQFVRCRFVVVCFPKLCRCLFRLWQRVAGQKQAGCASAGQTCLTCIFGHVLPRGLEPRTLRLLAVRSNQMSYESR